MYGSIKASTPVCWAFQSGEEVNTWGLGPRYPGGKRRCADSKFNAAKPICLRLLAHCDRRAASRAACTAGNNSAIKIPMIAITTNNSTNVNALRFVRMRKPPKKNSQSSSVCVHACPPSRSGPVVGVSLLSASLFRHRPRNPIDYGVAIIITRRRASRKHLAVRGRRRTKPASFRSTRRQAVVVGRSRPRRGDVAIAGKRASRHWRYPFCISPPAH